MNVLTKTKTNTEANATAPLLVLLLLSSATLVSARFGQDVTSDMSRDPYFTFEWKSSKSMPSKRSDLTATHSDITGKNHVYLIGGCSADQGRAPWDNSTFACLSVTDECQAFAVGANNYSPCASAPRPRYRHAAVNLGGKVYLLGGRDVDDNIVRPIDVYDPVSNTWTTPATWPDATSDLGAFVAGGDDTSIYAVGGYLAGYNASKKTTKFDIGSLSASDGDGDGDGGDPVVLSGTPVAEMVEARGDIHVAQHTTDKARDHTAYVGGGFSHHDWCNPLSTYEKFDTDTEQWSSIASVEMGRGDKAIVAAKGWVFAIGGEHNSKCTEAAVPVNNVDVYDDRDDTWAPFEGTIPEERFRFVAANGGDDHIYVFGGQTYYNATCDCFAVTDKVLNMEISETFYYGSASSLSPTSWLVSVGAIASMAVMAMAMQY